MELYEKLTDFDREIWAEELEEFVPAKVFDAHTLVESKLLQNPDKIQRSRFCRA